MLFFWSPYEKLTRSLFTFPLNGRDSSLFFSLVLLYSPSLFLLGQIISSPTPFLLFAFLDKFFSKSNSSSLFCSDKCILSATPIPQKDSQTIPNSVSVAKSFQFLQIYSKSHFLPDLEKFLSFFAYPFHTLAAGV